MLNANLRRQGGPLVALAVAALVAFSYEYAVYEQVPWSAYPPTWIGIYEEAGFGARVAGAAVAALLAGWQGGAEERNGARWMEGTSVRGSVPRRLMGLASGIMWPLAGYLLGMTAVLVWQQPVQPSGRIPIDSISVDGAIIVAVSCIAHLLGQTFPLRVTPLILGLAAVFLGAAWQEYFGIHLTYTGDPIPRQVASWAPPAPPVWLPWCRVVLVTVLAAAAVLLSARRWKPAAALAVVSVTGMFGLSITQPGGYEASALNTVELRCTGHAPAVCVSAPYENERSQLERTTALLSERLKGVREAPTHYVWTDDASCGENGVAGSSWAVARWRTGLESLAIMIAAGGDCYRYWDHAPEADAVVEWLTSRIRSPLGHRLAALPASERTAWLDRYFAATKHGVSPAPVPTPDEGSTCPSHHSTFPSGCEPYPDCDGPGCSR